MFSRPAENVAKPFKLTKVKTFDGPVSYDIEYTYSNMANQRFRIFKNSAIIEHEFALGPIKQGMEVIARFNTNIMSGDEFYTGQYESYCMTSQIQTLNDARKMQF